MVPIPSPRHRIVGYPSLSYDISGCLGVVVVVVVQTKTLLPSRPSAARRPHEHASDLGPVWPPWQAVFTRPTNTGNPEIPNLLEGVPQWNHIWVFPKIGVPPNHPILIGFSIIFTIHFGVPRFLERPYPENKNLWFFWVYHLTSHDISYVLVVNFDVFFI